jgi:hypothetical protein
MNSNDSLMVCALPPINKTWSVPCKQPIVQANEVLQYPVARGRVRPLQYRTWSGVPKQREIVLLYEYGGDFPYFQSNLNAMQVYGNLTINNSGNFTDEYRVGISPRTITIFSSP